MLPVSLLLAAAVMAAATIIERRLGPSAAGWVAALPVAIPVAVVVVTLDAGTGDAAAMALSVAAHVPAQVVFGAVFTGVLLRRGLVTGAVAGALAYAGCCVVLTDVPSAVAIAVAVLALAAAPRLMAADPPRSTSPRRWTTTALTCAASSLVVGATLITSRLAGPAMVGAVAAFPTVSTTLAVVIVARDGAPAGAHALTGLVRSLPCYLTFCLIASLAAPAAGLAAVPVALFGAVATARVTWRGVPVTRRPALAR
jgi:hypothetical protein